MQNVCATLCAAILFTVAASVSGIAADKKKGPGGSAGAGQMMGSSNLSIAECKKLGCTPVSDATCGRVVSGGSAFQMRCVCQGGGNSCIDEASQ
jgi:hypothetical protein